MVRVQFEGFSEKCLCFLGLAQPAIRTSHIHIGVDIVGFDGKDFW